MFELESSDQTFRVVYITFSIRVVQCFLDKNTSPFHQEWHCIRTVLSYHVRRCSCSRAIDRSVCLALSCHGTTSTLCLKSHIWILPLNLAQTTELPESGKIWYQSKKKIFFFGWGKDDGTCSVPQDVAEWIIWIVTVVLNFDHVAIIVDFADVNARF